jgi:hypothetical protein
MNRKPYIAVTERKNAVYFPSVTFHELYIDDCANQWSIFVHSIHQYGFTLM